MSDGPSKRRPDLPKLVMPGDTPRSPDRGDAGDTPDRPRGRDRSGSRDRKDTPGGGERKKKNSADAREAARIRAALDAAKARAASGESSPDGPKSAITYVDADALPEGELVKLSDYEKSEFEGVDLLKYSGAAATVAALGYLGYKTGAAKLAAQGFLAWKSLPVVDWLARGVDSMGDGLLKYATKKLPWPFRPAVQSIGSAMDKTAKWLGVDKTLYEHLKKNKEDRKKLAEKLLKDLRASEEKHEKKEDAKKKKKKDKAERDQKRYTRLAREYGADVAHIMVYEMGEFEDGEVVEKDDDADTATAAAA